MTFEDQLWNGGLKLLAAVVLSAPLGIERERKERPAGLRTHVLVCLGATLMMVVSELLALKVHAAGAVVDTARVAAGVITGVGFLGAGTILTVGANQKGLTTAAMIWFVAALGVAIGAGYIAVAACATVLALVVVIGFEYLERVLPTSPRSYQIRVRSKKGIDDLRDLKQLIESENFRAEFAELRFSKHGKVAEAIFRIATRRNANITSLAKAISEHYDDVEEFIVDR